MALVETGGNTIYWEDIEHWVQQGTLTTDQMASELNNDNRHFNDCSIAQVFNVLFDVVGVIFRDVGLQQDPSNDDPKWQGQFDTYHRNLGAGQRADLLKKAWNRLLTKGQASTDNIPAGSNPDPPEVGSQSNRYEKAGYSLKEWDEVCQELVIDPAYSGDLEGTDLEKNQQVHAAFVAITGGRRFGICTEADVQAVIDQRQAELDQQAAFQGTQDVQGRAANAVQAANDSYAAGNDRATVISDGDTAYNTPLP